MEKGNFQLEIGQDAAIVTSGETGTVIARAEYLHGERMYLVRYKAADGRAVESWWGESALAGAYRAQGA